MEFSEGGIRGKLADLPRFSYLNLPISNGCSGSGILDVYSTPMVKSDDVENTGKQKSGREMVRGGEADVTKGRNRRSERGNDGRKDKRRRRRKRIRIFTNHSARHLRERKSPLPLKSEEVERFIESWDTQSPEDTSESASETSSSPIRPVLSRTSTY